MTFISFKQLSPLMLFVITFTHSTLYCSRSLSCSRLFKWLRRVRNHFLNAFKITSSGWLWVEFIKAVLFFGSQMSRFENTCVRHHLMNMSFLHLWYASSGDIFWECEKHKLGAKSSPEALLSSMLVKLKIFLTLHDCNGMILNLINSFPVV